MPEGTLASENPELGAFDSRTFPTCLTAAKGILELTIRGN
jgi:hypothetical protein